VRACVLVMMRRSIHLNVIGLENRTEVKKRKLFLTDYLFATDMLLSQNKFCG
jgi:hypothetical protein